MFLFAVIFEQNLNPLSGKLEICHKLGFKCNQKDCKFVTIESEHISQHVSSHLIGKTFKCNLCDSAFSLQYYLTNHMNNRHNIKNKPIIRCPEPNCQYSTFLNYDMKQHSVSHSSQRHFKCGQNGCVSSFKTRCGLYTHRMKFHSNTKRHVCSYAGCGQHFETKDELRKHIGIHTKPFACDYDNCSFSTHKKVYLYYHKKNIHLKGSIQFKCDVCPKIFGTKAGFIKHKNTKHLEG